MVQQTQIKEINIDDLPCEVFQRIIDDWRRFGKKRLPKRGRLFTRYSGQGVGVLPQRLIHDWRNIERRAWQLSITLDALFHTRWDMIKRASVRCKEAGGSGAVWIPSPDSEFVEVYAPEEDRQWGGSLHSARLDDLIKESVPDPDRKAYVPAGEELALLRRLHERAETMRKRYWAYAGAFTSSVEERLREFMYKQVTTYPGGYRVTNPCAFLFSNDDRKYLITMDRDQHKFTWFGGTLFHDNASNVG